jgi:hypothetical protein
MIATAGELHRHRSTEALVLVLAGGQPVQVVRPDNRDTATGPADPLHLGQAAVAAVARCGGKDRARDDQIGASARDGQVVEKPVRHAGAVAVIGLCELLLEYLAQAGRGLDRHDLPPSVDKVQRQPP